jgi:cold shock CspA family protein
MIGRITYLSKAHDYSFLRAEDGKDYFLHVRDIENRTLPPVDTRVEFSVISRNGREKAVNAKQVGPIPVEARYPDL